MLFHEMRKFLQLFPEKFIEMQRHGSLFEKLQRFVQMDDFSCFLTKKGHSRQLIPEKLMEMQRHGSLFEKLKSFCQIHDLSCFLIN